jgi:hypothetical protein
MDEIERRGVQVKVSKSSETADALEFAALSTKRWRFYHEQGLTVGSIGALRRKVSAANNIELAFLCVARVPWTSPKMLGIALARRTWCGHLVLDFLATHPLRMVDGPERIKGIGTGLLFGISEVALAIGAKVLWGEATRASAPKYQHIFGLEKVDDLLFVPRANLVGLSNVMRERLRKISLV